MKLIDFQGLNCYYNSILTIAEELGVDWEDSFATFWSETDFKYDPFRKAYLTKRMLINLASLGARLEMLPSNSPQEAEESLSLLESEELFLVGMDAYYIPWVPLYNILHGPHYFIVCNATEEELLCFDPTYNLQNNRIMRKHIHAHSFDLSRIHVTEKIPLPLDTNCCGLRQAAEVLKQHPSLQQSLLKQIAACTYEHRENAAQLARYVDALISNRYLYRYYLQQRLSLNNPYDLFASNDFFCAWTAVKNGLYKASVSHQNEPVLKEVSILFERLICEEISLAEKVIHFEPPKPPAAIK